LQFIYIIWFYPFFDLNISLGIPFFQNRSVPLFVIYVLKYCDEMADLHQAFLDDPLRSYTAGHLRYPPALLPDPTMATIQMEGEFLVRLHFSQVSDAPDLGRRQWG